MRRIFLFLLAVLVVACASPAEDATEAMEAADTTHELIVIAGDFRKSQPTPEETARFRAIFAQKFVQFGSDALQKAMQKQQLSPEEKILLGRFKEFANLADAENRPEVEKLLQQYMLVRREIASDILDTSGWFKKKSNNQGN